MNDGEGTAGVDEFCEILLTEQERSVMRLVADGDANVVIGHKLFASEKTIERVLGRVYVKYGLAGSSKLENPRVKATLIFRGLVKFEVQAKS